MRGKGRLELFASLVASPLVQPLSCNHGDSRETRAGCEGLGGVAKYEQGFTGRESGKSPPTNF